MEKTSNFFRELQRRERCSWPFSEPDEKVVDKDPWIFDNFQTSAKNGIFDIFEREKILIELQSLSIW